MQTGQAGGVQRWVHPAKGRYYQAIMQCNLFGQWELCLFWGSTRSRHGGQRTMPQVSLDACLASLARLAKRRRQRGYVPA